MNAVLSSVLAVPFDLSVEIGKAEGLGKFDAAIAFDSGDDVVWRGVEIWATSVPVEFSTAAITAFAASLPLSSVEAAKMQRTMTPEYICQGCD
jgi:hypothetical protein